MVVAEREAVVGIEPAVVGFAAGIGMTNLQHGELLSLMCDNFESDP
jgi:hypothetical protein